jgi:hypothetical protein
MHHLLFSSGSTVNHMQIMQPKRKKKYVRKKGKTTNIKFNTQYGSQGNCKIKNQMNQIKNKLKNEKEKKDLQEEPKQTRKKNPTNPPKN